MVITSHPDYPSLLSISEALHRWHIRTMELNVPPDKLDELPLPFLAHIKMGGWFLFVEKVTEAEVICIGGKGEQQVYKRKEFLNRWDEIALLAQTGEASSDPNYGKNIHKRTLRNATLAPIQLNQNLESGSAAVGSI